MSIALAVGSAVAKATLKLWLRDHDLAQNVSANLVDLISARIPDVLERRKAQRSFERLADAVAERLEPFVDAELGGLPDNEREAAALAVADSLNATRLSDELLVGANLNPLALETLVRARSGHVLAHALLSPPAVALFDRLLEEACAYIVEVATSMPAFSARALTELLRRETETQQMLETIINSVPAADTVRRSTDAEFELRYRRELARELDRVELFGLTVSEFARRYTLSVAYISLTASLRPPRVEDEGTTKENGNQAGAGGEDDYVRVEEVLAHSTRTLLRGEAGSGKTTLLQWISTRSARRDFTGALAIWNDTVPFFIQLRRYVGKPLPRPEEFISHVTPNVVGIMPAGWVHSVLTAGRGIVLVDGVDELPEDERDTAREWLSSLIATFPDTRFIVTSRPAAIRADWLDGEKFSTSELQPMTLSDVASFVQHWHEAISEGAEPSEQAELAAMGHRLAAVIRDTPQLRSLATSPLLCAMLCALNRDRRAQLPRDRLELYRISLETLLERRDVERMVIDEMVDLALPQKELLLRYLAFWLVVNGKTDTDRASAIACLERRLDAIPNLRTRYIPDRVYEHLLNRSGLLREAVIGRTDFVHRTFQEYLAAKEIVEQDSIGMLLEHAGSDAWRDVIVLAVGHARVREREEVIRGLLERGDASPELRHRLHLLAVACLETARELSPELVSRLQGTLGTLVPPSNMTEARALASAGELAVPLLTAFHRSGVSVAAACVRTLALIGTPAAMEALTAFSRDTRVTVTRELIRAWSYFDPAEYAQRVLAESPLDKHSITVRELGYVPFIPMLRHAQDVHVRIPRRLPSFEPLLPIADRIVGIDGSGSSELYDLSAAGRFPRLARLVVSDTSVESLAPLHESPVRLLAIEGCTSVTDLGPLAASPLMELYAARTAVEDLGPLTEASGLRILDLGHTRVQDVAPVSALPQLTTLRLTATAVRKVPLASGSLTSLYAEDTLLEDLSDGDWRRLRVLELIACRQLRSVGGLGAARHLRSLDVSFCSALTDLQDVQGLPLRSLWMRHLQITDFSWLASLRRLVMLDLTGCSAFEDGTVLSSLGALSSLYVSGTGVRDFTFLRDLPSLRILVVGTDINVSEVLSSAPHLQLRVRQSDSSPFPWSDPFFSLFRTW